MAAKIKAELVTGRDLKPGDMFSVAGQDYWDIAMNQGSVGEMIYVRTNIDADRFSDADQPIYRLTVERSDE